MYGNKNGENILLFSKLKCKEYNIILENNWKNI